MYESLRKTEIQIKLASLLAGALSRDLVSMVTSDILKLVNHINYY